MIEVNKMAFANLIEQFVKKESLAVENAIRYFKTNEEEREWIKIANKIDILFITPNVRIVQLEFGGTNYFAIIGASLDSTVFDDSVIEEIDLNAGIITLLISLGYINLDKKANYLEFYDNILFQHNDKSYKGHDYNDFIPFLEQVYLFKTPEYSIVKTNMISRIACYIFSKNSSQLVLDFDNDVTDIISELSLVGSDNISYKILLSCLFSTTYKHAFLELYRLIERLFPINYLKEFHTISETKLSFLKFSAELENITSWRPKEDDAIEKIFENTKPSVRKYFEDFHNSSNELRALKDSKYFYTLRNSIVHFRANHLDLELNRGQWNLFLIATLFLLDEQYSIHNEILK